MWGLCADVDVQGVGLCVECIMGVEESVSMGALVVYVGTDVDTEMWRERYMGMCVCVCVHGR